MSQENLVHVSKRVSIRTLTTQDSLDNYKDEKGEEQSTKRESKVVVSYKTLQKSFKSFNINSGVEQHRSDNNRCAEVCI